MVIGFIAGLFSAIMLNTLEGLFDLQMHAFEFGEIFVTNFFFKFPSSTFFSYSSFYIMKSSEFVLQFPFLSLFPSICLPILLSEFLHFYLPTSSTEVFISVAIFCDNLF